jgi:hypothetical protein
MTACRRPVASRRVGNQRVGLAGFDDVERVAGFAAARDRYCLNEWAAATRSS